MSLRQSVMDKMRDSCSPGPIYEISSSEADRIRNIKFGTGPARYNDVLSKKGPGPQSYDPENIRSAMYVPKASSRETSEA